MKTTTILFLLFLFTEKINAQDTIMKNNGESIIAKVIEISSAEIKYQLFGFEDGPVFIESKSSIEKILFSNGTQQNFRQERTFSDSSFRPVFIPPPFPASPPKLDYIGQRYFYGNERINEPTLHSILLKSDNKEIKNLVAKAKAAQSMQYSAFGAIPFGVAALYFMLNAISLELNNGLFTTQSPAEEKRINNYKIYTIVCFTSAISCNIFSTISKSSRHKNNRMAIETYWKTEGIK